MGESCLWSPTSIISPSTASSVARARKSGNTIMLASSIMRPSARIGSERWKRSATFRSSPTVPQRTTSPLPISSRISASFHVPTSPSLGSVSPPTRRRTLWGRCSRPARAAACRKRGDASRMRAASSSTAVWVLADSRNSFLLVLAARRASTAAAAVLVFPVPGGPRRSCTVHVRPSKHERSWTSSSL